MELWYCSTIFILNIVDTEVLCKGTRDGLKVFFYLLQYNTLEENILLYGVLACCKLDPLHS